MTIKIIEHFSDAYRQMVQLRNEVLLAPSGIPASYIDPHKEADDIHIGAFDEGKIVGCCVLSNRGKAQLQLRQMAVLPELQGKGLGAAIVSFAEQTAMEKGIDLVFLHARNPVIPFYQKIGYQVVGAEFFEVGIGHHRMEKAMH